MAEAQPSQQHGKSNKTLIIISIISAFLILLCVLGGWAFWSISQTKKAELQRATDLYSTYNEQFLKSEETLKTTISSIQKSENSAEISNETYQTLLDQTNSESTAFTNVKNQSASSSDEIAKRITDSSNSISIQLSKTNQAILADQCGRNKLTRYQILEKEIDDTEKSLGQYIIILDDSTAPKLITLSQKYKELSDVINNSIQCFDQAVLLTEDARNSFSKESETYQKISDTLLRQSAVTNNVDQFNAIGKERPTFFTVYFTKSVPLWLKTNRENIEERLLKIQIDHNDISEFYKNLTGKRS